MQLDKLRAGCNNKHYQLRIISTKIKNIKIPSSQRKFSKLNHCEASFLFPPRLIVPPVFEVCAVVVNFLTTLVSFESSSEASSSSSTTGLETGLEVELLKLV